MTRINKNAPAVPELPKATPAAKPSPAARSTALTLGDEFTSDLSPRPMEAESYKATFASYFNWTAVSYAPDVGAGGPHLPNVAEAGKPLFIEYSRLPSDIGLSGDLKKVELFYKIDGGPIQSATIAEGQTADAPGLRTPHRIDIPANATGEVEYWFKLTTEDGAEHYDSNFGHNFKSNILPAAGATVKFDDLWGESLSGPIKAGSTLRLAYDVDRIKPFLSGTSHHGAATWNAIAWVSFDGKAPQEVQLTAVRTGDFGRHTAIEPVEGLVEVPKDAKTVSVWIQGRAYAGGAFDSDFGKNYTFNVEP